MYRKQYILIAALLFFILNCTSDRILQKNTSGSLNNTSNDLDFDWSSDNDDDYNEFYTREDDPEYKANHMHQTTRRENIDTDKNRINNITKKSTFPGPSAKKKPIEETSDGSKQKLKTYKIQKGDNLFRISKKFNVPLNDILRINKIKNNHKIQEGMIVKIPEKSIQKNTNDKISKNEKKSPDFNWPLKEVYSSRQDGADGIKPIGIIITGKASSSVLASADGRISKIGNMRGFGNYVIIMHLNKYLTIYSNLKEINVSEGEIIKCGKKIGRLDGNRLHFQIGYSGKPVNPLKYLSKES